MQAWANPPKYGCINNPEYIAVVHAATLAVLKTSADGVQHDDAATNGEAVGWLQGDPAHSGCYCDHCMAGFAQALLDDPGLNSSIRTSLNLTKNFSYRAWLLNHNLTAPHGHRHHHHHQIHGPECRHGVGGDPSGGDHAVGCEHTAGGTASPPGTGTGTALDSDAGLLRKLFVAFQQNSTERYVTQIRQFIQTAKAGTPLSCNNGGRWSTPYHLCDYGLGELSKSGATPGGLEAIFRSGVPPGRVQVMTMPKAANITAADTNLVRWAIATATALGSNMIVPWDIYLPTPDAARYFGSAADFADLFRFVRANAGLFDGSRHLNNSVDGGASFKLVHTGAAGDGARFELPTEKNHPSNGHCSSGPMSLAGCEWLCLQDDVCDAVYAGASQQCCVLHAPLVVITGTGLFGDSLLRLRNGSAGTNGTSTPPPFASSTRSLSVYPRRVADAAMSTAVHVIDWVAYSRLGLLVDVLPFLPHLLVPSPTCRT